MAESSRFPLSLFIFRRDLRLYDNTALLSALSQSEAVIPCFIFDPRQIADQPYKGQASLDFMLSSLTDLGGQLTEKNGRLYIFEGLPHEIVSKLISLLNIKAVFVNDDYTPFSRQRDKDIRKVCESSQVSFCSLHDALLNEPTKVKKEDGGVYTIFTPYARKAMTFLVPSPRPNGHKNYYTKAIDLACPMRLKQHHPVAAGRTKALHILAQMARFKDYDQQRDIPFLQATTGLSAHHKFGTCSIREVYHKIYKHFGPSHALIREIYWRDFFCYIGYHFPHVLGSCFHAKYQSIKWENDPAYFKRWCEGTTGFPIVDAGMRQLNQTGFMHNRLRMITASFLVKDLHIDWRWGEKYFAQRLADYDPLVNNGNWQWAASTGCDAQPYFRIFNPWLQQEKYDPQAQYIKQWVTELRDIPSKDIHGLAKTALVVKGYPTPIVSHEQQKAKALALYNKR